MTPRAPGQDQQSDHWNGDDEAQRDLAQDERPSRVDAERHDRKSGHHRDVAQIDTAYHTLIPVLGSVTSRRSQSGIPYWVNPCMIGDYGAPADRANAAHAARVCVQHRTCPGNRRTALPERLPAQIDEDPNMPGC
jgi:hypothetical protein